MADTGELRRVLPSGQNRKYKSVGNRLTMLTQGAQQATTPFRQQKELQNNCFTIRSPDTLDQKQKGEE